MAEWFVVSFDQITEGGFKTVKVTAPNDDEAIRRAGEGFNVAFRVKENATYGRPVRGHLSDEANKARLLQKLDDLIQPYQMDGPGKTDSDKSV